MRDVAQAADVSVSTVSLVLSEKGRLDAATRARVKQVADRMGYRVNHAARSLRRGRSGILVISASLPPVLLEALPSMEYYVTISQAATLCAAERGYMLLMAPFGGDAGPLGALPLEGGIVLDPDPDDPLIGQLRSAAVPIVTVGRDVATDPDAGWWVDSDLPALVTAMLRHMAQQGAERIALLTSPQRRSYVIDTEDAYHAWCTSQRREPWVVAVGGAMTEEDGHQAVASLLAATPRPDAIYTPVDRFALAAINAATSAGLRVPEDLLVGSGNDTTLTRSARVPVTSLSLPSTELGRAATELLLDRLMSGREPQQVTVAGQLRLRQSTDRGHPR